jgi:hypothetical protein
VNDTILLMTGTDLLDGDTGTSGGQKEDKEYCVSKKT